MKEKENLVPFLITIYYKLNIYFQKSIFNWNNVKLAFVTKLPSILERVQVLVSIDARNDLSPFGAKPFYESMLTL